MKLDVTKSAPVLISESRSKQQANLLLNLINKDYKFFRLPIRDNFQIFPQIYSSDSRYSKFLADLYDSFKKNFKPSEISNSGMFIGPPIKPDFEKLRTRAGVRRSPLSFDRPFVEYNSIGRLIPLIDLVVNLFNKQKEVAIPKVPNNTSTCFPHFKNDTEFKLKMIKAYGDNIHKMSDLIMKDLRIPLFKEFGFLNVDKVQIRLQQDIFIEGKIKKRPVVTFSNRFLKGNLNEEYQDESYDSFFYKCRTRVVCAGSFTINSLLAIGSEGYRQGYKYTYEKTYVHHGDKEILAKVRSFRYAVGVDVSSFDQNVPINLLFEILKRMDLTDVTKKLYRWKFLAPWFHVEEDGNAYLTQDIFSEPKTYKGLPSGLAGTDMFGDLAMTVILVDIVSRYDKNIIMNLHNVLLHNYETCFLIKGDDSLILTNNLKLYEWLLKNLETPVIKLEVEKGISYLGNLLWEKNKNIFSSHNPISFFANNFVPEKPYGSFFRMHGCFGFLEAIKIYKDHPMFMSMLDMAEKLWEEYFSFSLMKMMNHYARLEEQDILRRANHRVRELELSEKDILFLLKPERLHYLFTERDINPTLLEIYVSKIPDVVFKKYEKFLY